MSKVTFDYSKAAQFVSEHEVEYMKKLTLDAKEVLFRATVMSCLSSVSAALILERGRLLSFCATAFTIWLTRASGKPPRFILSATRSALLTLST